MSYINSFGRNNSSLRINTRPLGYRSTSNTSFHEKMSNGLKVGTNVLNNAITKFSQPIPGAAALTASLSDAARSLGGRSIDGAIGNSGVDGDINNVQDNLFENSKSLLDRQYYVSQMTAMYTAQSQVIRAVFETYKGIAANIK